MADWPVGGRASWRPRQLVRLAIGALVFGDFGDLGLWGTDSADRSLTGFCSSESIWDRCFTATLILRLDLVVAFSGRKVFTNTVIELQSPSNV